MKAGPARTVLCLTVVGLGSGCGGGDAREGWDPAVARAVARAAAAEEATVVLETAGRPATEELSWGVRQALTTAGIIVVDSAAVRDPDVRVLVLESGRRDGEDWLVHTYTLQREGAGPTTAWRVRCLNDLCEASPHDE